MAEGGGINAGEHVLTCLSAAPSNAKVIRTAARLAEAFHSRFTALYVETGGGRPGDGGWLECGGARYEVMAVHGIPLGDGVSHQWAALERRMEDAV